MSNNEYDQQPEVQAKQYAPIPEPTPIDLLNAERQAALVLKLALEIFLQVPSMAAIDAIDEGVSAYHEAWIRGRKRVL